jgi:MoaA/NifB/PqqE/SkfB family radical SAM enzyme
MTPADWERVIDQAAALGVATVQFIGGEPTLDPDMPRLARYALSAGLEVSIYTNMVHVSGEMWELFTTPGVLVGFSWYSADPDRHAEVTGNRASYDRTLSNIREAVRRGVRLRAGLIDVTEGQDIEAAMEQLRAIGVADMRSDRSRRIGRAARGEAPAVSELCGQCGKGLAAIGADGQVSPCVLGRFLIAGNVKETPLGEVFAGERWRDILATVPPAYDSRVCAPDDTCGPAQ